MLVAKETITELELEEIEEIYQDIVGDLPKTYNIDKSELADQIIAGFHQKMRIFHVNQQ